MLTSIRIRALLGYRDIPVNLYCIFSLVGQQLS